MNKVRILVFKICCVSRLFDPVDKTFEDVRIGTFTWVSFLSTVVLFGLEHNYILAGIMAGIFYNLLLYRTRSLAQCVLAHAVTNLALAGYVISTGKWQFW